MDTLPTEVWIHFILPNLCIIDICKLQTVSKQFNSLGKSYMESMKCLYFDEETAMMLNEEGLKSIFISLKFIEQISLSLCWKSATENNLLLLTSNCSRIQIFEADHSSNVTDNVLTNLAENCPQLEFLNIGSCYNASI